MAILAPRMLISIRLEVYYPNAPTRAFAMDTLTWTWEAGANSGSVMRTDLRSPISVA